MRFSFLHPTLLVLAALSAFTLPPARSGVRDQIALVFVPVAAPARAMGKWVRDRLAHEPAVDALSPDVPRSAEQLRQQNNMLLSQIVRLETQLEDLKQLSAQYSRLGDLRKRVQPASVIAGPRANRQTLLISTSDLSGIQTGMPVVNPDGFIGKITSVAPLGGSASVLLVTDPDSRIQARLARFAPRDDGGVRTEILPVEPVVVIGNGADMLAQMLPGRAVQSIARVGDLVILDDASSGAALKGLLVGRVKTINLPPTSAGHASLNIEPTADFRTLAQVLVVNK
jgi:rod shape-determining protein MreC